MPAPEPILPMEAKAVPALPHGPGWQYEPKWDGFRCLAYRDGGEVYLSSRTGKPFGRYFPEVVAMFAGLEPTRFVLDGELVVPRDGILSFDALGQRLHPAESRVRKLAAETPAQFIAFDCLADASGAMAYAPLSVRRLALERLLEGESAPSLHLSPATAKLEDAEAWLARTGDALDGVMAKRLDDPYRSGERAMLKVKTIRTADCVVGGYRLAQSGTGLGSLLLGLYNSAGTLDHVGFTSAFKGAEREAVFAKVAPLAGGPGFTGKAPEGQSRWARDRDTAYMPLGHELVVEVSYDQVSSGRFRHGTTIHRWRVDKAPAQCTAEQLAHALAPAELKMAMG